MEQAAHSIARRGKSSRNAALKAMLPRQSIVSVHSAHDYDYDRNATNPDGLYSAAAVVKNYAQRHFLSLRADLRNNPSVLDAMSFFIEELHYKINFNRK